MLSIFVVSDSSGETADRVVHAALVQFPDADVRVLRQSQVRTAEQVHSVVREAAGQESLILHTLVSDNLRRVMLEEARRHGVDSMDLMGPLLDRLTHHLNLTPQEKPGLFQQLAEVRSREIEAVEFAFRHDDGLSPEELDRAEVVLVGASRTMKTPTMLFLAYRGWFAANVPLVPEISLPPMLEQVDARRVFCMMITPYRLMELRRVRAAYLGLLEESYASLETVRAELRLCQRVCREHGWRTIDVTCKSVEEVAREIMVLLDEGARRNLGEL